MPNSRFTNEKALFFVINDVAEITDDLDDCMILMTDLIINHHQSAELALSMNYRGVSYVNALLLANSSGPLTYSSKRGSKLIPSVCVVVYVVVFNLFIYTDLLFSIVLDDKINNLFTFLTDHCCFKLSVHIKQ